ncbi:MAG: ABC transporter permease [Alphaproteobacteria bacterium]|jgi:putative spermidine/putrescine transport system permease protein|nr:ABC transporter permease [Alphaproteobacteria bacterium]
MALPQYATPSQRIWHWSFRVICVLVFFFLVAPIIVIIPISVSSSSLLNYPLPGLSWKWFEVIFTPYPWMLSLENSIIIASATTLLATILGTLAAYGLTSAEFRFKPLVMALLLSPMMVPLVITALAAYFVFARVGLSGTFTGMILAHTVLAVPFVVITVTATLQGFDRNMVRAAQSLGARPITAFFGVTLPLIMPGVISGAIFAFVTSFDEIVVALFIASPAQHTLPRQLFSGLRDNLDPSIVAIATLLIGVSVLLMAVVELLRWRSERLARAAD